MNPHVEVHLEASQMYRTPTIEVRDALARVVDQAQALRASLTTCSSLVDTVHDAESGRDMQILLNLTQSMVTMLEQHRGAYAEAAQDALAAAGACGSRAMPSGVSTHCNCRYCGPTSCSCRYCWE